MKAPRSIPDAIVLSRVSLRELLSCVTESIKFFGVVFLIALSHAASAAESFPSFEGYLEHITGESIAILKVDAAEHTSPKGKIEFGIVRGENMAIVFVLETLRDGQVREVAKSSPFEFFDPKGRTYVEIVQAQSDSRFSVQINYQNACGPASDVYRFSRVGKVWYVSGLDSCRCEWGGENVGDTRTERSANFLTGKVIEKSIRKNAVISVRTKQVRFPSFPFNEFAAFDDKYGPR